ncbi:unnamed protein product [Rotaria sordida]|uniref:Secreted protein n=1 Tax=Rotaria sordida TaxID=392033 RepID=A0A819NBV8_9BILA|nr:unnamed protein product [Rotaria sordida]CAF3992459.1 unnamed protein product [Rotaria sordida]
MISFAMYWVLFTLLLLQIQPLDAAPGDDNPPPTETTSNAIIEQITEENYNSYIESGRLMLTRVGESTYIPNPNVDPVYDPCWREFDDWFAAHYPGFQAQANSDCRPLRGGFGNHCICVLFRIDPQDPPCKKWLQYTYEASISIPEHFYLQAASGGK